MPIPLGILAIAGAGGGFVGHILLYSVSSSSTNATSMGISSTGAICHIPNSTGDNGNVFIEVSPQLAVSTANGRFQTSRSYFDEIDVALGSNGKYIALVTTQNSSSNFCGGVYVENSSHTLQWGSLVSGPQYADFTKVFEDSSGNIYVLGRTQTSASTSEQAAMVKLTSAGALDYQRTVSATPNQHNTIQDGDFRTNDGMAWVTGYYTGSVFRGYVELYDPNGTLVTRKFDTNIGYYSGLEIDSSGNYHIAFRDFTNSRGGVYKIPESTLTANGSATWVRTLNNADIMSLAMDSTGASYLLQAPNSTEFTLVKVDSSGNVAWQRKVTVQGGASCLAAKVEVNSVTNKVVVALQQAGNLTFAGHIAFPLDGNLLGTYPVTIAGSTVSFVIQAGTLSSVTGNNPAIGATSGMSNVNNATVATMSLSARSATITSTLKEI